jgi:hypothetical protein
VKNPGYGRYKNDPDHIGCPRAKSDMTPCIARDGKLALDDLGECVGCGERPSKLLLEIIEDATAYNGSPSKQADKLKEIVYDISAP